MLLSLGLPLVLLTLALATVDFTSAEFAVCCVLPGCRVEVGFTVVVVVSFTWLLGVDGDLRTKEGPLAKLLLVGGVGAAFSACLQMLQRPLAVFPEHLACRGFRHRGQLFISREDALPHTTHTLFGSADSGVVFESAAILPTDSVANSR